MAIYDYSLDEMVSPTPKDCAWVGNTTHQSPAHPDSFFGILGLLMEAGF